MYCECSKSLKCWVCLGLSEIEKKKIYNALWWAIKDKERNKIRNKMEF